jgi:catechol 2,3-dioxygenase-like lactoylglutathione lyase family enzyme
MSKIPFITGIQQIGIGTPTLDKAWDWYIQVFGMDVQVFDDAAEAALMTRYTNNKVEKRRAALALNMAGGGGFEIWQYTSKVPQPANFQIALGDLGIYAAKMKSPDVAALFQRLQLLKIKTGPLETDPIGRPCFWLNDLHGYPFQVVSGNDWFKAKNKINGGVAGAVIGVSNMEASIKFYSEVLGISEVVYDKTASFADLGVDKVFRRVLLRKPYTPYGAFSRLLGSIEIELVQAIDTNGRRTIFENRFWGDCGYIHLCFDTINMDGLKEKANKLGHPFTVDSGNTFDMGESGGRFAYLEDPDGALIELVETHKVPIMKKFGLYLTLKNRKTRQLPNWMVALLGLNKRRPQIS